MNPKKKLLQTIFNKKTKNIHNTSLQIPPNIINTIINTKVFQQKNINKNNRTLEIKKTKKHKLLKNKTNKIKIVHSSTYNQIVELLNNHITSTKLINNQNKTLITKNMSLSNTILENVPPQFLHNINLQNTLKIETQISQITINLKNQLRTIHETFTNKIQKFEKNDKLTPNMIKIIKIYITIKHKLQINNKITNRHNNKNIINHILPIENIPYLPNKNTINIILNPLNIPSQININQILKTHLNLATQQLNKTLNKFIKKEFSPKTLQKKISHYFNDPKINT